MSKSSNHLKLSCLKDWTEGLKRLRGYKKPKLKVDRWEKEVEIVDLLIRKF